MLSYIAAIDRLLEKTLPLAKETISIDEACGRVTCEDIIANASRPQFRNSVVQPLKNAFDSINPSTLKLSASLGVSTIDSFCSVQLPLIKKSILTASVLAFTHTLGEIGVVLMIGGNVPGKTKVASVAIYDHVELMQYQRADVLSLVLIGFSTIVLTISYKTNKNL